MLQRDPDERARGVAAAMDRLLAAHRDVGGEVVSAGGTGTYAINRAATEIQAGSYALMDTAYAALDLPFRPALSLLARVISVSAEFAVADCGLKALGMDHGNPTIAGARVRFCSDEHITFAPTERLSVGDRVQVVPAHIDPTMTMHEAAWVTSRGEVIDRWPIDLRGW
jgi:D-serine deaminase-like pyridoxal phosphate-dependent protein